MKEQVNGVDWIKEEEIGEGKRGIEEEEKKAIK